MLTRLIHSPFFIRLFHWEFWPFGIIQFPLFIMWLWYGFKEKALFYFSACNPSILTGGMMGESKFSVLKLIPKEFVPVTFLVSYPVTWERVNQLIITHKLRYPLILKPNVGERGWGVSQIYNEIEGRAYVKQIRTNFLVQEYLDLPLEFGVYYVRFPSEEKGRVTSITGKEFLSICGDGKTSFGALIGKNKRAQLQKKILKKTYASRWNEILPLRERCVLQPIGNHCLGTQFLNKNELITNRLSESFDRISRRIEGFYFGRFDVRCASLTDLENGKVKIMELNGCGAEPSHIYQPGYPLWKAVRDLIHHWRLLYTVSVANHNRGVPYMSFAEGKRIYYQFKKVMQ